MDTGAFDQEIKTEGSLFMFQHFLFFNINN